MAPLLKPDTTLVESGEKAKQDTELCRIESAEPGLLPIEFREPDIAFQTSAVAPEAYAIRTPSGETAQTTKRPSASLTSGPRCNGSMTCAPDIQSQTYNDDLSMEMTRNPSEEKQHRLPCTGPKTTAPVIASWMRILPPAADRTRVLSGENWRDAQYESTRRARRNGDQVL